MILGRLYLVATPRPEYSDEEFLTRIRDAIAGGVDLVQLRCKDMDALPYLRLAERVLAVARDAKVPFIVNDRADIALAIGADGVHLGQNDLPVQWARCILGARIVGRSSHEPAQASAVVREGATYFAVGPVWATPTKPGRKPAGLGYVEHVAAMGLEIPWYAIGGITPANLEQVIEAGALRVAAVRALLDAPDPAQAAASMAGILRDVPLPVLEDA